MTTYPKPSRRWIFGALTLSIVAAGAGACEGDDSDVSGANDDAGTSDAFVASDGRLAQDVTVIDASTEASTCTSGSCVTAIAANGDNSCALMGDTTVRCWGDDDEGELGFAPDAGPIGFDLIASPTTVVGVNGATSISIGGYSGGIGVGFICTKLGDGGASCWGVNGLGQLGRGDDAGPTDFEPTPAPVLLSNSATQISANGDTACALYQNGSVACWGGNAFSQIDPSSTQSFSTPTLIAGTPQFTQVSVGTDICAVSADKHVWCWGLPINGSTARAVTDGGVQDRVPAQVQGLENVVQVASGGPGACALLSDGTVSCWGGGGVFHGTSLLGRGDVDSGLFDPTPEPVVMPSAVVFTQLVGHEYGFCALASSGDVWCWGNNYSGVDGIVTLDGGGVYPVWIPTKVSSLTSIVQLAGGAAGQHMCALDRSGVVRCWGYNVFDQLGVRDVDASLDMSLVPLVISF